MITLWIPAIDSPRWPCVAGWWNLKSPDELRLVKTGANNVKYSWNKAVSDFLKSGDEWLFSVHNDVVLHEDTLLRLLSWEKPLISAMVFMRNSPVVPHIWRADVEGGLRNQQVQETKEWLYRHPEAIGFGAMTITPAPADSLTLIDFTSMSCALIHRSVLEDMKRDIGEMWFVWDDDHLGGGEDRNFFVNAKKAGYQAYVDRSAIVGHLVGDIPTSTADFVVWEQSSEFETVEA